METSELSVSERERFLLSALQTDTSARARRRARILLDALAGKEIALVARELKTSPARIQYVLRAFEEKRLASFSAAALKRVTAPPKPRRASPPLTAQTSLRVAARRIIAHQAAKLKHTEQGVRFGSDIEAVHAMRVACRRMNSAFRLFRDYLPKARTKKLRRTLEELRDVLGAARNLDVLRADLETFRADAAEADRAELQRVADAWDAERAIQQRALIELLDSEKFQEWRKQLDAFLNEKEENHSPHIAAILPALLWQQYGAVRAYETEIGNASLEELHGLRIQIKRLRYTLEFFAETFGEKPDALLEPLIALQDELGVIHDAAVAGQALTGFVTAEAHAAKRAGQAAPDFRAIAAYHADLQARIQARRAQLSDLWECVIASSFRERLAQITAQL